MAGREQVIAALKAAYVQGRLTKEEFDLRVGQALAIYAELDALTADIPAAPPPATARAELARQAANRKMTRQGTAGIAGLTFVLVTALIMPTNPALAVIVGVVLTSFLAVLTAGLMTLLSWPWTGARVPRGPGAPEAPGPRAVCRPAPISRLAGPSSVRIRRARCRRRPAVRTGWRRRPPRCRWPGL